MDYRPSKKRPLSITLVAAAYILAPVLMPLQVLLYREDRTQKWFLLEPSLNAVIVMVTSVIVGVGIYSVHKWGWYFFLAHAVGVVINNFLIHQRYPPYPLELMVVSNIVLLSLVGYFVWSNVRAPYFNPRLRWWEPKERVRAQYNAAIKGPFGEMTGETLDFSESGAFVKLNHDQIAIGSTVQLRLDFASQKVSSDAEVVWKADAQGDRPKGVGLKYINMSRADQKALRQLIEKLKADQPAPTVAAA
jgi:hypothetical protein